VGFVLGIAVSLYLLNPAQDGSLPVDQLCAASTLIGVATVTNVEVREGPEYRKIFTYYTLKFNEVWKGTPADPATLRAAGGKLGNRVSSVAGRDFRFEAGDSIVLFAHEALNGPYYVVIGLNQGLYQQLPGADRPVMRISAPGARYSDSGPGLTLSELKREVCAALGVSFQPPGASVPILSSAPRHAAVPPPAPVEIPAAPSPEPRTPTAEPAERGIGPLIAAALVAVAVLAIFVIKKSHSNKMS
jgi:hypothetical protein